VDRDGKTPFDILKRDGYRSRRFAMLLASGEGDPAEIIASWRKDSQDRETLFSRFDRAGVGVATDEKGIPYWVLLMAERAAK
jgi:uncharacterized protein YkwD